MQQTWFPRRFSRYLPTAFLAAFTLVNWLSLIPLRTLPFTDVPNHLAESIIFKEAGAADMVLHDYFRSEVSFDRPNIAHIVAWALFPSVELGCKITYLMYVIAVPFLTVLLIRISGGDSRLSLLSVVTLWNFPTLWGFVGYTIAIPFLLLYLLIHLRSLTQPMPPLGAWMALAAVFLFLYWSHVQVFLFAVTCFVCIEIIQSLATRRPISLLRASAALPGVALFLVWLGAGHEFAGENTFVFLSRYYQHAYVLSIMDRIIGFLWNDHARLAAGTQGRWLGSFFSLAILLPVVCYLAIGIAQAVRGYARKRARGGDTGDDPHPPRREAISFSPARRVLVVFTLVGMVCYLGLPATLPGQAFVYQRHSVFVVQGLICLLAWLPAGRFRLGLRVMAVVVGATYCILWSRYFRAYGREAQVFTPQFLKTEPGSAGMLAAIIDNADFRGGPVYFHFNNYHIVWNHGVTPTRLVEYRFGAIRRAPGATIDLLPPYKEWISPWTDLAGLLERYRNCPYLLVRGDRPYASAIRHGEHELVRSADGWALFRKTAKAGAGGR